MRLRIKTVICVYVDGKMTNLSDIMSTAEQLESFDTLGFAGLSGCTSTWTRVAFVRLLTSRGSRVEGCRI